MFLFMVEEGVCNTQVLGTAKFQQSLPILVHLPYSMVTKTGGPNAILSADSCIKIAKQIEILCLWHLTNELIKFTVEPVFNLCTGFDCGGIYCYKVNYAIAGV